ncbi:MAG: hypothetical protein HKN04_06785 [Rhodothermaceae bacterium]|nr:hypothetical protein [Rhodothermaceae bacterium]
MEPAEKSSSFNETLRSFDLDPRLIVAALVVLVLGLGAAVTVTVRGGAEASEEELVRLAASDQMAWRNYLRQDPAPLGAGLVTGALEATDALGPDDHLEDYYAFEATDDEPFSVVVTSAAFTPDLMVVTPDSQRMAASVLRATDHRAEVTGLAGAGRYFIAVTSRESGIEGPYELSAGAPRTLSRIGSNDSDESVLGVSEELRAERYENIHALELPPGRPAIITVAASAFRPRLYLLGPEGQVKEPWGSLLRLDAEGEHAAELRFEPGWDVPYTLLVSSEEPRARGSYTLKTEAIRTLTISTDGNPVSGELGKRSWFKNGRYVDTYRFEAFEGAYLIAEISAEGFAPKLALTLGDRPLVERTGGRAVRIEQQLDRSGTYALDVSSAEEGATGRYSLSVTMDTPEGPRYQSFTTDARRVGRTTRGHRFEVTVTRVRIVSAGSGRAQVRLNVTERSLDFEGEWDTWQRRAPYTWLSDDTGRRYNIVEANGGEVDEDVTSGEARRGGLIFEAEAEGRIPKVLRLHYPIGVDRRTVVTVPIPLER